MLNQIVFIRKGNLLDNPNNPIMRRPWHQHTKLQHQYTQRPIHRTQAVQAGGDAT